MYLICLLVSLGGIAVVLSNPVTSPKSIIEAATEEGGKKFLELLTKADLKSTLEEEGPNTVFVPTDEAFKTFESTEDGNSISDPERLKNILLAHIVKGKILLANIESGHKETSLEGCYNLEFSIDKNVSSVNGAVVISADIEATNGVVNIIDKVLVPEVQLSCLQQSNKFPLETSASVVEDVLYVAEKQGFSTLLELLREMGIDSTLAKEGYFIIFAPTNEAFGAINATEFSSLRSNPEKLKETLLSHIVQPEALPVNLTHGSILTSLSRDLLEIVDDESGTFVNGAPLNNEGFGASNGVLYSITQVLFLSPKNAEKSPISALADNLKSTSKEVIQSVEDSWKNITASEDTKNKTTEVDFGNLRGNVSEAVTSPKVPEAPKAPEAPEVPEAPVAPEAPEAPEVPEAPVASETPEAPGAPVAPEAPKVPGAPEGQVSPLVYVTEPKIEKLPVAEKGDLVINPNSTVDESLSPEEQPTDVKPSPEETVQDESAPVVSLPEGNIEAEKEPLPDVEVEEQQVQVEETNRESRAGEEIDVPSDPLVEELQDTKDTHDPSDTDQKVEPLTQELEQNKVVEPVEEPTKEENKEGFINDKELTVEASYTDPKFENQNPEKQQGK